MTLQDYKLPYLKAYYKNSLCPAEVGGPRRQKHARSPGLNIQPHETLGAVTRQLSRREQAIIEMPIWEAGLPPHWSGFL